MKKTKLSIAAAALAGVLVLSAAAVSATQIAAELRADIIVKVNGQTQTLKDASGKIITPLTYQGTVYLPVRALGQALNQEVTWDSASQVVAVATRPRQAEFTTVDVAETRMSALEKEITALKPGATHADRSLQYEDYTAKLNAFRMDLDDVDDKVEDDFELDRTTYAVYSALDKRIDALETRAKAAWVALKNKTIATQHVQTPGQTTPAVDSDYTTLIASLAKRVEQQVQSVYDYKTVQDAVANRQAMRQLDQKLEALDNEADRLENSIERDYKSGKLTAAQYRALDQALEQVENKLDDGSDYLEDRLGYDD